VPKRYSVQITATAQTDIEQIWDYIARDNPAQATHHLVRLERAVLALAEFPERNSLIPENVYLNTQYRHAIVGNYRIIYRIQRQTVWVARVLHGAMVYKP
jgi:plasmid stabilization system protein ParE